MTRLLSVILYSLQFEYETKHMKPLAVLVIGVHKQAALGWHVTESTANHVIRYICKYYR